MTTKPLALALAAVLAGTAATLGVTAGPAAAHNNGGQAVVRVIDLTLAPAGGAWTATAAIVDSDSGTPIRGVDVKAFTGSVDGHALAEGTAAGVYSGSLGEMAAGPVQVELKVRTRPGAEAVVPYNDAWTVELVAGQPTQVVSAAADGGSQAGLILGVAAAVLILALLYGLFALRRRTPIPARAP